MTERYLDVQPTPAGRLGQRIYLDALHGRRGFRPDQIGIPYDDDVWAEIFEAIGRAALSPSPAEARAALATPPAGGRSLEVQEEVAYALLSGAGGGRTQERNIATGWAVRRLTPIECERLQGFPDDFTNIPWRGKAEAPDGPRYKALGNSMAVNVMGWLGERIELVDSVARSAA